jgi:hypothetical protein
MRPAHSSSCTALNSQHQRLPCSALLGRLGEIAEIGKLSPSTGSQHQRLAGVLAFPGNGAELGIPMREIPSAACSARERSYTPHHGSMEL